MKRTAEFSPCGKFRWWLQRRWADGPLVCFIMLNPSTADAMQDDPTVRRCIRFAQDWGFGALSVRNVYPYKATHPKDLKAAMKRLDVTGGSQGLAELEAAKTADLVIAAWGSHASEFAARRAVDATNPRPLWCLGLNDDGKPSHPLMLKSDLLPQPFIRCQGVSWKVEQASV